MNNIRIDKNKIEQIIKGLAYELNSKYSVFEYNIVEKYIEIAYCYGYKHGQSDRSDKDWNDGYRSGKEDGYNSGLENKE